jgi:hypothetical protein
MSHFSPLQTAKFYLYHASSITPKTTKKTLAILISVEKYSVEADRSQPGLVEPWFNRSIEEKQDIPLLAGCQ